MKDLNFMIVNSKLSHARAEMPLLQERVSFEVFQETEEELVWDTLEGGKDDMYIYDRCGRLSYFIPFPLSIMNEETSLIQSALMATYFRSPCGVTCDESTTSPSEKDLYDALKSTTPFPILKEHFEDTDSTDLNPDTESANSRSDGSTTIEANVTDTYDFLNISEMFNLSFNDSDYETNNETDDSETPDFYNLLQRLYRNEVDPMPATEVYESNSTFPIDVNVNNHSINTTDMNENDKLKNITEKLPSNEIMYHQHEVSYEKENTPKPKSKPSDRCAEADFEVCKSWSKKKLLRAQRCCSSILQGESVNRDDSCQNFGKRRCKKIKSLLKCCIKTHIVEVKEETTTETSTTETSTDGSGYVCCKTIGKEKLCRVSEYLGCEEGELLEKATNQKK